MKFKIGDRVHDIDDEAMEGTVIELFTRPGVVTVRWDNGTESNHCEKELRKIKAKASEVKPPDATETDDSWIESLYVSVCKTLQLHPVADPKASHLRKVVTALERSFTDAIASVDATKSAPITDRRIDILLEAVNAGYAAERKRRIEIEGELGRKDTDLRNTVKQLQETKREYVSREMYKITLDERNAWCARATDWIT